MILINATILYKGYNPNDLKPKSNKKICCSCDQCGRVRYLPMFAYRSVCGLCSTKGKNNGMYGKHHSDESKRKISKSEIGKIISDKQKQNQSKFMKGRFKESSFNWKGGIAYDRSHLLTESACIKLNTKFKGSEFHHITKFIGVFIPKELHDTFIIHLKTV